MSVAGTGSANRNNDDNIIFSINETKIISSYIPIITLSTRDNQKFSKLLSKGFEISVYLNEYKTKSDHKNTTNGFRYFLESNFVGVNRLFVSVYTDKANNAKKFNAQKHYLHKGIIKNYDVIINGKNIYDKAIDSDIKRYTEIGKLATG